MNVLSILFNLIYNSILIFNPLSLQNITKSVFFILFQPAKGPLKDLRISTIV